MLLHHHSHGLNTWSETTQARKLGHKKKKRKNNNRGKCGKGRTGSAKGLKSGAHMVGSTGGTIVRGGQRSGMKAGGALAGVGTPTEASM